MPTWGKTERLLKLRQSESDTRELMDELDQQICSLEIEEKRKTERYRYRARNVQLGVIGKDGATTRYHLPSRNISRRGMSLLIGQFVYPGLRCVVDLIGSRNQRQTISGSVAFCRYLIGSAHLYEIGVRFAQPIDVASFCRDGDRLRALASASDTHTRRALQQTLDERAADFTLVETVEQLLSESARAVHELVILDLDGLSINPPDCVATLRAAGHIGPIFAIGGEFDERTHLEIGEAGCLARLVKPIRSDALDDLIRATCDLPVYSSLMHEARLVEQIDQLVAQLPRRVAAIEVALSQQDWATLRQLSLQISSTAGFCGFDAIFEAAESIDQACGQTAVDAAIACEAAEQLLLQCRSARPASIAPRTPTRLHTKGR